MSVRRVDPRFALPFPVENAVVLGGLDPWMNGLREAGIEVSGFVAADVHPQLVVAPVELASDAISTRADLIVLEGRGGAAPLRRAGFHVHRLVPTPSIASPRHLLRADHPRAAVYAVEHASAPTELRKRFRNTVAKVFLGRGRFPEVMPVFAVGMRADAPPFLLAAARKFGVPGNGCEWFMTLGEVDTLSRSAFHVFAAGASEPGWIVKFARIPGYTAPFDRDERGLRLAAAAGATVEKHAPRLLGRLEVTGLHASVERAAAGYRLTQFLQLRVPREEKLRVVDSVAAWIVELGKQTARDPATLDGERERLARDVVPQWVERGIPESLVAQVPRVPSVLQHGDIGGWNVITRGEAEFTVIDWEAVREFALPLWDLVFFLSNALVQLEHGSTVGIEDQLIVRLFRGELPSSETLFRWVRHAVEALGLPAESVGPIVTLCWLDHGVSDLARTATRRALNAGERWADSEAERIARLWVAEPGLGPGWDSWRSAG